MKELLWVHGTIQINNEYMKKLLTFLSLCFLAISATAQQKADVYVGYDVKSPRWTGGSTHSKMSLLANKEGSKYFNEISQWTDSLASMPGGKAQLREIIQKACLVTNPDGSVSVDLRKGPVKNIHTYVFNNLSDGEMTVYGKWADTDGYYKEPLSEISWNIVEDSTANVIGYECVLAEADYHGRHWCAWFTPEIPIPFGPWKLQGLPGLILKAEADSCFSFVATGLESSERIMTPMYLAKEYSKVDRRKALADQEHYYNNFESMMNAAGGGKVKIQLKDENGNNADSARYEAQKHSIEPDYK